MLRSIKVYNCYELVNCSIHAYFHRTWFQFYSDAFASTFLCYISKCPINCLSLLVVILHIFFTLLLKIQWYLISKECSSLTLHVFTTQKSVRFAYKLFDLLINCTRFANIFTDNPG